MIRAFMTIIIAGFLSSCTSGSMPGPDSGHDIRGDSIPFAGFWIREKYIHDINATKSALQSQNSDESCIFIPRGTHQITRMVYGFHDGGPDLVVVKNGSRYQLNPLEEGTATEIELISEHRIKIGDKFFVRLNLEDEPGSNPRILEELLFKGKYRADNGARVEFLANGQIKGLDDFGWYRAVTDYTGPALDIDQIEMGKSKENTDLFGFKFERDVLTIYKLNCIDFDYVNNQCDAVDFGQLVYKLRKEK